jgi:hypothetical protein
VPPATVAPRKNINTLKQRVDVKFAANCQRQENEIIEQSNAEEKSQATVSDRRVIREVSGGNQHHHYAADRRAEIRDP